MEHPLYMWEYASLEREDIYPELVGLCEISQSNEELLSMDQCTDLPSLSSTICAPEEDSGAEREDRANSPSTEPPPAPPDQGTEVSHNEDVVSHEVTIESEDVADCRPTRSSRSGRKIKCSKYIGFENGMCRQPGPGRGCFSSRRRKPMAFFLFEQLEANNVPGLTWNNRKLGEFTIRWTHAAQKSFNHTKDLEIFKRYAIHTGKFVEGDPVHPSDPQRWKTNFRCAMNSLGTIEYVKEKSFSKGQNAVRCFRFLPDKLRQLLASVTDSSDRTLSDDDSSSMSPTWLSDLSAAGSPTGSMYSEGGDWQPPSSPLQVLEEWCAKDGQAVNGSFYE